MKLETPASAVRHVTNYATQPGIDNFSRIVQPPYNTPCYNMDLDITQSCCGSQIFLTWNITNELKENDHTMVMIL